MSSFLLFLDFLKKLKYESIRRSGISHIIATKIYSTQANHEFRKESHVATIYNTIDTLPLKSRPTATPKAESLP
jgi:hypothetical protein